MNVIDLKEAIRARDGYRCVECGMTNLEHRRTFGASLQVHRVVPGSEYALAHGVCVTLCVGCHSTKPKRERGSCKIPGISRVVLMVDPDIHGALKIEAAISEHTLAELISGLIREHLAESLQQVRERRQRDRDALAAAPPSA